GSAFSAGSLLVSGASVSLFGSGTVLHLNFDVKAGSLSWSNSASLDKLTLEGGSFGGSGTLTVSTFDWHGGQLGDGGGTWPSGGTLYTSGVDGQILWQAPLFNQGSVEDGGGINSNDTLTLSGGDGQSLLPTTYQGGTYKPDNSRAVIELQYGTFSSNQVGGGSAFSAGSLLVSGASVSLFGSGTLL